MEHGSLHSSSPQREREILLVQKRRKVPGPSSSNHRPARPTEVSKARPSNSGSVPRPAGTKPKPKRKRVIVSDESSSSISSSYEIFEPSPSKKTAKASTSTPTPTLRDEATPRAKATRDWTADKGSPDPLLIDVPRSSASRGNKPNMSAFKAVQARLRGRPPSVASSDKYESSDDELDLLGPGSPTLQRSPSRKLKQVLKPRRSNEPEIPAPGRGKAKKAGAGKVGPLSDWSDDERTPRPKIKHGSKSQTLPKGSASRSKKDSQTNDENDNGDDLFSEAHAFFKEEEKLLKKHPAGKHSFRARVSSDSKADRMSVEDAMTARPESPPAAGGTEQEELDDDLLYCSEFVDHNNLCPYCHEPMPKTVSDDLVKLQKAIKDSTNWRQTISYCTMHRAATHIIPLGQRDGFPATIDFENLDKRLERGFIGDRLRRVAAKPHLSSFFRRARRDIQSMGVNNWKALGNQATDSALSVAIPGYYGDLGRDLIIRHFQLLSKWNMLRSLSGPEIRPLNATDFISIVLVPEAAVLLIMEDKGWTGDCKGKEWDRARKKAKDIRNRSAEYGHWRFPESSEEGTRVRELLKKEELAKRERIEEAYLLAESESTEPQTDTRRSREDSQDGIVHMSSAVDSVASPRASNFLDLSSQVSSVSSQHLRFLSESPPSCSQRPRWSEGTPKQTVRRPQPSASSTKLNTPRSGLGNSGSKSSSKSSAKPRESSIIALARYESSSDSGFSDWGVSEGEAILALDTVVKQHFKAKRGE